MNKNNQFDLQQNEIENIRILTKMFSVMQHTQIAEKNWEEILELLSIKFREIPSNIFLLIVNKIIEEETFFPSVAQFNNYVTEAAFLYSPRRIKSWDEALAEIQHNLSLPQLGHKMEWSTEELKQTIKTYGWYNILNSENEQVAIAQIKKLYDEIVNKRKSNDLYLNEAKTILKNFENNISLEENSKRYTIKQLCNKKERETCPECDGKKEVIRYPWDEEKQCPDKTLPIKILCPKCNGEGVI